MAVLYRKYRPQTFGGVVGQEHIVKTLQTAVSSGAVAHAYLFTGSRGVGKTSVARILAKAVNCLESEKRKAKSEKSAGDACGECEICKQVEKGSFLDLVEIDAASNTGVDNVRELIEQVKFQPSLGKFKVFIIDEAHMLSRGAFNALLKTLEEPPSHAIFVLATTEPHKLPATIISRTQRFDFLRLSEAEILKHLAYVAKREALDLPEETLSLIAQNAQGGMRDALSLLDKVLTLGKKASVEDAARLLGITSLASSQNFLQLMLDKKSRDLPEFLERLMQDGADFAVFNKDFLEYLRKLLVVKLGLPGANLGLAGQALRIFEAHAGAVSLQELIFIIRLFLRAYKELPDSPSPELPLLLAAVESSLRGQSASSDPQRPAEGPKAATTITKDNENSISQAESEAPPVRLRRRGFPAHPPSLKAAADYQPALAKPAEAKLRQVEELTLSVPHSSAGRSPRLSAEAGKPQAVAQAQTELDEASLEEIQAVWPKVAAGVRNFNSPLATLLKNSPVTEVQGGIVIIGVKYLFHKENLESLKNRGLIIEALKLACGKNLGFGVRLVKSQANSDQAGEALEVLSGVLQVFGGEVVE